MNIKETGYLNVLADFSFPENRIVINPNDGFDLGLMMTEAPVAVMYNENPATFEGSSSPRIPCTVIQKNECRTGTVELSLSVTGKMGAPRTVRLHLLTEQTPPLLLVSAG